MVSETKYKMEKNIRVNKKLQYAIRMLLWHTDLAKRYMDYIKKWLDNKHLNYDVDLMQLLNQRSSKERYSNQTTIYDFLKSNDYE
jgi:hypothetical protein